MCYRLNNQMYMDCFIIFIEILSYPAAEPDLKLLTIFITSLSETRSRTIDVSGILLAKFGPIFVK